LGIPTTYTSANHYGTGILCQYALFAQGDHFHFHSLSLSLSLSLSQGGLCFSSVPKQIQGLVNDGFTLWKK
jgi:hypothetical protein